MWKWNTQTIEKSTDLPVNAYGFIYIVTNTITNKKYLGKKALNKGTRWQSYYGSSDLIKQDIKTYGKESFSREIIHVAYSQRELTYYETKLQFIYEVLESDAWYNSNILGRFYKKHINLFNI